MTMKQEEQKSSAKRYRLLAKKQALRQKMNKGAEYFLNEEEEVPNS